MGFEPVLVTWPPLRLTRMRFERGSVGVVCPPVLPMVSTAGVGRSEHATLVFRTGCPPRVRGGGDLGGRDRPLGGSDTRTTPEALRLFAGSLCASDEVAIEATCNTHAIARLLERHVGRVVVSNPTKTRAIAEAKVKTDKVDGAGVWRSCWPLGFCLRSGSPTRRRMRCAARSPVGRTSFGSAPG